MGLTKLVRKSENGAGMLWEDTRSPARDGRIIERIDLPNETGNINFIEANQPNIQIPEGYDLGYRRVLERVNGVMIYRVVYIVAKR
ncbi:hypothetical protein J4442_05535 [Candidatus Woesearchaeota archaeon]|nr:hypothetical protein [Candidatus Woesearchaeota archaeon]